MELPPSSWGRHSSYFIKGRYGLCGNQSVLVAEGTLSRGPTSMSAAPPGQNALQAHNLKQLGMERGQQSVAVCLFGILSPI